MAFSEIGHTFREITRFRVLVVYLAAYLMFNDGVQTVLAVAGAFGSDTLDISLVFNVATILIVQFVAAGGAMLFSQLADWISTKRALTTALIGWGVVIALAVGFAPLEPRDHKDFDYQLEHTAAGVYEIAEEPELDEDRESDDDWTGSYGRLLERATLSRSGAADLASAVAESNVSRFSISMKGGPLDGTTRIGQNHPSVLGAGPIDWWPRAVRSYLWEPLGISVDLQWLILGLLVGIVLGGSQALSRSLFAYMMPESRSAQFFGFFAFVGRSSAVFGPMVYLLFTGIYDTRMAILVILLIILAGTTLLRWTDVEKGRAVAAEEDRRVRAGRRSSTDSDSAL